jgi:hypothetical protein
MLSAPPPEQRTKPKKGLKKTRKPKDEDEEDE